LGFVILNPEGLMGRTVLPFSQVLEQEVQEWRKFRRGLRREDQQFLDRLFEEARLHVQAGVYASRPWPFETILISILLEHEKILVELRAKLKVLETDTTRTDAPSPSCASPLKGEVKKFPSPSGGG
jgi:hypothetical protein